MYKIRDLQFEDRYFGGDEPTLFETKREACEQLIDYHSIDCDMKIEQGLLDAGKIDECWEALAGFEWELIDLDLDLDPQFIEELEAQIDYQSGKDLTGEWTEDYREGYVDGLRQALAMYRDKP